MAAAGGSNKSSKNAKLLVNHSLYLTYNILVSMGNAIVAIFVRYGKKGGYVFARCYSRDTYYFRGGRT